MFDFYLRVAVYLLCYGFALYGMSALDFNRLLKKNASGNGALLYILLSLALAYLLGNFLMSVIYYFQV